MLVFSKCFVFFFFLQREFYKAGDCSFLNPNMGFGVYGLLIISWD